MHHLNRSSGGSCGLYGAKNECMVAGVGFPYMVASWSKMSRRDIVEFHPVVGRFDGDVTLNELLTYTSSVSYHAWYMFFHVLK